MRRHEWVPELAESVGGVRTAATVFAAADVVIVAADVVIVAADVVIAAADVVIVAADIVIRDDWRQQFHQRLQSRIKDLEASNDALRAQASAQLTQASDAKRQLEAVVADQRQRLAQFEHGLQASNDQLSKEIMDFRSLYAATATAAPPVRQSGPGAVGARPGASIVPPPGSASGLVAVDGLVTESHSVGGRGRSGDYAGASASAAATATAAAAARLPLTALTMPGLLSVTAVGEDTSTLFDNCLQALQSPASAESSRSLAELLRSLKVRVVAPLHHGVGVLSTVQGASDSSPTPSPGVSPVVVCVVCGVGCQAEIAAARADRLRHKHTVAGLEGRIAGLLQRAARSEEALVTEREVFVNQIEQLQRELERSSLLTTEVTRELEAMKGGSQRLDEMRVVSVDNGIDDGKDWDRYLAVAFDKVNGSDLCVLVVSAVSFGLAFGTAARTC